MMSPTEAKDFVAFRRGVELGRIQAAVRLLEDTDKLSYLREILKKVSITVESVVDPVSKTQWEAYAEGLAAALHIMQDYAPAKDSYENVFCSKIHLKHGNKLSPKNLKKEMSEEIFPFIPPLSEIRRSNRRRGPKLVVFNLK